MSRRPAPLRPRLAATAPLLVALAVIGPLLAACGSESVGAGSAGAGAAGSPTPTPVTDPGMDGVRITSFTGPGDSAISAAYEVTNDGTEALTYSVIFTFTSSDGGSMGNKNVSVRDLAPGKTARGTIQADQLPSSAPLVTGAKVSQVLKVPAAEAPAEPGTCPASGIRVNTDEGEAAMGLRVVGLHLDNCGTGTYTVEGYPSLELLDKNHKPVTGIRILKGSSEITTGAGPDEQPRPITLKPGESASANLVWRNTTQSGTPVNVPYVRIHAKPGAAPVMVTPGLDLGTTGKLGVRPWKKTETR
ncbi:DUF4232 domain-containing protein [Streptomyces sp. SID3212]|uniref:DUF4232 domain-containing protein n=1 Tax=Streptomyces sp. SID3212 TaxID=2690259 RepID=UPI001371BDE6|nr:DUF4232 domain-containing protein [Streptomyces sp. SID3212]MYV58107.1 DUF4232 domain-containing protein [Streptomyces sp. SID3212]